MISQLSTLSSCSYTFRHADMRVTAVSSRVGTRAGNETLWRFMFHNQGKGSSNRAFSLLKVPTNVKFGRQCKELAMEGIVSKVSESLHRDFEIYAKMRCQLYCGLWLMVRWGTQHQAACLHDLHSAVCKCHNILQYDILCHRQKYEDHVATLHSCIWILCV